MSAVSWAPQYQNGQIPVSILTDYDGLGHYLHPAAASTLHQMSNDYAAAFGTDITISEGYRTIDTQWYYWNLYQSGQGNVAAYPGSSTHGEAIAVDINSWVYGSSTGTDRHQWLREQGPNYGWDWYLVGQPSGESWHFNYIGSTSDWAGGGGTPIEQDDDEMLSLEAQQWMERMVHDQVDAVMRDVEIPQRIVPQVTDSVVPQINQSLNTITEAIKVGIRREARGRYYFDSGLTGTEYTELTAPRAVIAKVTDGFVYPLNADPNLRQGQVTSLRNTHYLLIDAAEVAEGLPTAQFNNLLEQANGHLRRLAAEVVRQIQGGETPAYTVATVPANVNPTPALPQVASPASK